MFRNRADIYNCQVGTWQRQFLRELFKVVFSLRGRVNFTGAGSPPEEPRAPPILGALDPGITPHPFCSSASGKNYRRRRTTDTP